MAMELTHVWLLVEDMPRALGFYRDTLGLAVAADLGGFVELNANERFLLSLFLRSAMRESEPGITLSPVAGQHAALTFAIQGLDTYCAELEYLPITTAAMREAARLWAQMRQSGRPTASANSLDGDMILGPAPLFRVRDRARAHVLIKTASPARAAAVLRALLRDLAPDLGRASATAVVDVDPQTVG